MTAALNRGSSGRTTGPSLQVRVSFPVSLGDGIWDSADLFSNTSRPHPRSAGLLLGGSRGLPAERGPQGGSLLRRPAPPQYPLSPRQGARCGNRRAEPTRVQGRREGLSSAWPLPAFPPLPLPIGPLFNLHGKWHCVPPAPAPPPPPSPPAALEDPRAANFSP